MKKRRVVITGLGVITPIGVGKEAFWDSLVKGKDGISKITSFDTSRYRTHRGGEIKDTGWKAHHKSKDFFKMGRASQLAIAAVSMALDDAGLENDSLGPEVNIYIGSALGESSNFKKAVRILSEGSHIPRSLLRNISPDVILRNILKEFSFKGGGLMFSTACASGNYAISRGYDLIKSGEADLAVVGATDALSSGALAGFNRLFIVSPDKCSPFSKDRKGMVISEGAAILILEAEDRAKKRDCKIYTELLGYGLSCEASHPVRISPDGQGVYNTFSCLFNNSILSSEDIDYINAHGTGTINNDIAETNGIKKVFGNKAYKIPISSIKSMLGHSMGAASAIEAVCCSLAVDRGVIPPTINYKSKDPGCDLDYVPNKARNKEINVAVSNSFGFGGNNSAIAIGRYGR